METLKKFRVVDLDETCYWKEGLFKGEDTKVLSRYLYDPESHTYCCSLTPTYEMHFMKSSLNREETDRESCILMDGDSQQEQVCYMEIYSIKCLPYGIIEAESIEDAIEYALGNYIECDKKD